jgi:hypothetical protein
MRPCASTRTHGGLLESNEPLRVDVASRLFGLVGGLAGFYLVRREASRVPGLPNLGHSSFFFLSDACD